MNKLNWLSSLPESEARAASARFWEHLSEHAYPLSKGSMRIPVSLEPFVLSTKQQQDLNTRTTLLISAARKLVKAYFTDLDLQETLAVDPGERVLIESSKDEPLVGVVRLDLLYANTPQVIEINADFPDGLFMHDITADAIAQAAGLTSAGPSHAALFSDLLREQGIPRDAAIYIGYDTGRNFIDEFEVCRLALRVAGWTKVYAGPFEDLEHRDGHFYFNDEHIKVSRRGAELSKLRKNPELIAQLQTAARSGLHIVNNFKMRLLGHKSLLAALHDPRFAHYLTAEEIQNIQTLVPKTFKLDQADTQALVADKDRWVLKPSDLAEGAGVVVGSSVTEAAWQEALRHGHTNPTQWIVQHKAALPEETFAYFDEAGRRISHKAYYDLDPHVFLFKDKNVLGKTLVRFSNAEILNIAKGGGITYAFPE